jgi:hypothetical protein
MKHTVIAFLVFLCVFGSAMGGLYLRRKLPVHHVTGESTDAIKLATGLIATLAALVLGLLVSSAKNSLDSINGELVRNASAIMQLDHMLQSYGPAAQDLRKAIVQDYRQTVSLLSANEPSMVDQFDMQARLERLQDYQMQLMRLPADNDAEHQIRTQMVQLQGQIASIRLLLVLQREGSISIPLLTVLVLWLIVIFAAFGLLSPPNGVVIAGLLLCALSASCAIFLILEMDRPLDGVIRISTVPLRDAVQRLAP